MHMLHLWCCISYIQVRTKKNGKVREMVALTHDRGIGSLHSRTPLS